MFIVYSDAGHGGTDPGAMGGGFAEKWGALKLDTSFSKELEKSNVKVIRTRDNDRYYTLKERTTKANNSNAKILVSHHMNAFNRKAEGLEVCYTSEEGKKLAKYVLDELWKTGIFKINRGLKHRPGLYMLKNTKMPSIIIEYGFVDNDEERARVYPNFDLLGQASAIGVKKYLGISNSNSNNNNSSNNNKTNIISSPRCNVTQMKEWATRKKANKTFIDLADLFYSISLEKGIDPCLVYAQSAKETGYMNFGGVLDISFKNTCGLKTPKGGGDYDRDAHTRFNTWEDGISAHVDHLALYAGQKGFPNSHTKDPRHFPYLLGTAKYIEDLGGKWAPSKEYGKDIVKMMNEISSINVKDLEIKEDKDAPSDWAKEYWDFVETNNIMSSRPKDFVTREELAVVIYRLYNNK